MKRPSSPGFPTYERFYLKPFSGQASSITPSERYNGDLSNLLQRLIDRLANLAGLVEKDVATFSQFVGQNTEDETLRLPDSGIYEL